MIPGLSLSHHVDLPAAQMYRPHTTQGIQVQMGNGRQRAAYHQAGPSIRGSGFGAGCWTWVKLVLGSPEVSLCVHLALRHLPACFFNQRA